MTSFLAKFPRCYYIMAKEVFESSITHKKIRYLIYIFLMLYCTVRATLLLYVVFYANDQVLLNALKVYDPSARYFAEVEDISEPLIAVSIALFTAFDFFCQRAFLTLNVNTITWRWWHELIVVNQETYFQSILPNAEVDKVVEKKTIELSRKWKWFEYLPNKVARFLATCSVYYHFEHVDGDKLFGKKMKIIPQISRAVRIRTLRFLLVTDWISYFFLLMIALICFVFISLNLTTFLAFSNYWFSLVLVSMDFFFMIFGLLQMIQAAFFFTNCTLLGTIVYAGHVVELNGQVEKVLSKYSQKDSSVPLSVRHYAVLSNALGEHNKVCYLVMRGCTELFGSVLLAFICTNLPVNVFLLRRNILLHYSTISNLISWIVVFAQMNATVVVFAPLAWCAEVYHSPRRWIPKLHKSSSKNKVSSAREIFGTNIHGI